MQSTLAEPLLRKEDPNEAPPARRVWAVTLCCFATCGVAMCMVVGHAAAVLVGNPMNQTDHS